MDIELVLSHSDLFLKGVVVTAVLTVCSLAVGLLIAIPSALAIVYRVSYVSQFIRGYVYVFRGTPMLVQAYLIYYGLSQFSFIRDSIAWVVLRDAWWCCLIAFSLNTGAYTTEIIRGAIVSLPKGEVEAAKAYGLHGFKLVSRIILPSALRRALPQYSNEVIFMLHGSAIASVLTIQDILGAARTFNAKYYLAYDGFFAAAILYMLVTFALVMVFRRTEKHLLRHLVR